MLDRPTWTLELRPPPIRRSPRDGEVHVSDIRGHIVCSSSRLRAGILQPYRSTPAACHPERSSGAAGNRRTISLLHPPCRCSSARTIGANRNNFGASTAPSAGSRPPRLSTRPAASLCWSSPARPARLLPMPASPTISSAGRPPRQDMHHAEQAGCPIDQRCAPARDRAWGHYRAQAPHPLWPLWWPRALQAQPAAAAMR